MKDPHELMGVGLGLPGPVQRGTGSPESDHLLSGWKGVPVAAELRERLISAGLDDSRVVVGNDASFGALGVLTRASWGNPEKAPEDLIYVRVTHGVGMGIVIKGHLVTGADGFAGEIGHVRVDAYGPICTRCGRRGCLEVMASEKVVIDILRGHNWHEGRKGPNVASEVAVAGDRRTRDEVGKAGWTVGFAFAAVANVLNPAWIVLGGILTEVPSFREHFEAALRAYALPQAVERLRTATWNTIFDDDFLNDRPRDVGRQLTPELLGAMAFVVDEFADEFLRPKVLEVQF
jgi:predicted NBD/HSP70 family sugar kinase